MKKWITLAATVGLMLLIFALSHQEGAQSHQLSAQVADKIASNASDGQLLPGWFSQDLHSNLRKWAHVFLYCALGASMAFTVYTWRLGATLLRQTLWALLLCTGYAALDELHQYFVPGRAMLLTDVVVDMVGYGPCIVLVFLLLRFWQRRAK
ncbi:MAG: VanZ family protein [Gemmiger sp.]